MASNDNATRKSKRAPRRRRAQPSFGHVVETTDGEQVLQGGCGSDENENSSGLGPCFGSVKFEPRFHSAISAGLWGVWRCRSRVPRASLSAAAAAAARRRRH